MLSDRWVRDEDGDLHQVWIPKVGKIVEENLSYMELQNYVVPAFFAIMVSMLIFGIILFRDNDAGQRQKHKEKILDFMEDE